MPILALFVPSAGQCLRLAAPFFAVAGLVWLMRHGQGVIARLFPHWEWEQNLGWLNLKAQKRAEFVVRGVRHLGHAGLLVALIGILAISFSLGTSVEGEEPGAPLFLLLRLLLLAACLLAWITYFTFTLAPRLRAEYEREDLERYRRENPEPEAGPEQPIRRERIAIWDSPIVPSPRRNR